MLRLANLLLVLVSVAVGAGVVELFLRFDDASTEKAAFYRVPLAGNVYELIEPPERIATVRGGVAVLGDSFVVGAKCGPAKNLTGHLAAILSRDDVVNLGVNGTGAFGYAQRLRDYVAAGGAPSTVVAVLYSNDISFEAMMCPSLGAMAGDGRFSAAEVAAMREYCRAFAGVGNLVDVRGERAGGGLNVFLHEHSYVYRLLREVSAQIMVRTGASRSFGRAAYPDSWGNAAGLPYRAVGFALEQLVQAARLAGARTVIVFYPNVENLSAESPLRTAYDAAGPRLQQALGVPVHSGYGAFLGNPAASESMVWSLTDSHPSCEGHAVMARWIADRLRETAAMP